MTAHRLQLVTLSPVREIQRRAIPRHKVQAGYDVRLVMVLAFAANVLGIGWAGVLVPGWSPEDLLGEGAAMGDEAPPMVEVVLQEQAETPPASAEPPVEIVPIETVEMPPEPVPALVLENVFEIPAPPELVRPLDVDRIRPERPQPPAPQTQPRRSAATVVGPAAPTVPGAGTSPAPGGSKGKKAKTPQPPYPAFARSEKMTGTVVVSILVDAAGSVASASVARSSGHPALDSYTCNYIRRSWRWPEGGRRTFTQPVSFRLR